IAELIEEELPPSLPAEADPSLTWQRIFADDEGRKVLAWTDARYLTEPLFMNFKVGRRRYRQPLKLMAGDDPGRYIIHHESDEELLARLWKSKLIEGVER